MAKNSVDVFLQYEAPSGEKEEKLAQIWCELLDIDGISRHNNFFALGGHSLLVEKLLAQLRKIGLDTTVQEVFDAPTLTKLASKLTCYIEVTIPPNLITKDCTAITPEMLPLITLSQTDIDAITAQVSGGVANIQDIYGLTPLQNGMLYYHLMAKKGDPYLLMNRLRFIDRSSLERYANAVQQAIERHDTFRVGFFWDGLSEPAQVVFRQIPSMFTEITLKASNKTALDQFSKEFDPRHCKLDLKQAPLLRSMEPKGSWVAVQLLHYLISDSSTEERLHAEIQVIWNGEIAMLKTPTSFRHFVAHARFGINPVRFFTEMLGDIDEPTLPFGLSTIDRFESDETDLELPQTLNDQLRAHARNLRVSLASICHLAWAQVLAKASGRESVVFGTVLHGRLQAGEGNTGAMGPMINTLPIRLNIDERSVETAVRDSHARLSALLVHEQASIVLAQRCSGIPSGMPLFSSLLNYRHNQDSDNYNMSRFGVVFIDGEERTNYPLNVSVEDDGSSLGLTAEVICTISATRICAYMQQALESTNYALSHTPQQPVHKLTVMPPDERTLLLHNWNQIMANVSASCCLHQLFEAQVDCDGTAIAVECQGQTLTYLELNIQANRLAHHLIAQGVKPDDRIALCAERSTAIIVSILGILKAGCAYVPLDPVFSSRRLTNILRDADPTCLLADGAGLNALGNYHQFAVIKLENPLSSELPIDNPDKMKLELTSAHLAYIIYTSGSTGTPKGVMIEHRNATNCLLWAKRTFTPKMFRNTSFSTSVSFDMSLHECFAALSMGKTLHVIPNVLSLSKSSNISMLCTVPSAVVAILNADSLPVSVNTIHLAGEPLKVSLIDRIIKQTQIEELVNLYGQTETSFFSTWHTFKRRNSVIETTGRPISNTQIYLLDAHQELVPLGAGGEIYIAGANVARGYLNHPELTAVRFLCDPFSADPNARMYRTGDLARYRPDGNLVFLGRVDQQVKIRGFRIELGEIEARLIEHHQVHEAAVQSVRNGSDTRLVAYIVADSDTSLVQNLRSYLINILPEYMVPAAYVCLSSLPLTPSGKLDRRALPTPDDEAFARQQYEAPQNELEEKLVQIWRKLLKIDTISRHDNFFALGGHSLLIVRLLANLREIKLDTTAREVFDSTTLAILASKLVRYKAVIVPPNLITENCTAITPEMLSLITLSQPEIDKIIAEVPGGVGNIQDIYGLTSLQNGMLFHRLIAKEGDPYLTMSRIRFSDRSSLERYADALQLAIERHDILRTAFFWDCLNEPAQVILRRVPSLLSEITLDESYESVMDQLSHNFNLQHHRLDLKQAPLYRLLVAPASEGNWVALELIHHLIMDNSSQNKLQEEIYAIMAGKMNVLITISSFRQFVAQVRLGDTPADHTRFFTEMLGDIVEPTLPFGLSNIKQDGTEIDEAHLELSHTLNGQLQTHARNLHVSLASICHLAWAQVLAKASGRESVVFGTVLLGRLQGGEGNDSTMGPMINMLPIRLDVDKRSVETAVRDAHAGMSALLTHEHAPLLLALRCSAVPSSSSLFSAVLNYRHNQNFDEFDLAHFGVTYIDEEERTNYPLMLSVEDDGRSMGLTVQVSTAVSPERVCAYMQQALMSLAIALVQSPHQSLKTLTVTPPEERTLMMHSWNQTTVTDWPVQCLHETFESQLERNENGIAVEWKGATMTYAELNSRANRLAHFLTSEGVKPDDRIALCVERNSTLIISILGILKAGCAYVPLDPTYPSHRLTSILHDADPKLLITDSHSQRVLGDHQVPAIDVEQVLSSKLSVANNPEPKELGLTPAHLAYVIYTSGSTGAPKGVMIEHRNATNCLNWINKAFEADDFKHTSFSTSINFDMSVYECFAALSMGKTLHVMPNALALSKSSPISLLDTVPSAVTALLNTHTMPESLHSLHLIGEPLKANLIERIS